MTSDLTISIINWNTREFLDQCLSSVFETVRGIDFDVVVVDNASSDGSTDMVREKYPLVRLIENRENVGFARANNQAYDVAAGRLFMLLNSDTICLPDAIGRLVRFMDEHSEAGVVGPLVLNSDRTLQFSWARFPTLWTEAIGRLDRRIREMADIPDTVEKVKHLGAFTTDWVGGCCLIVRKDAADQVGPMDDSLFMYCEETDWCYRLRRAGWEVWVEPNAEIIHLGGMSSKLNAPRCGSALRESKVAYFRKHHGFFAGLALGAILSSKERLRALGFSSRKTR